MKVVVTPRKKLCKPIEKPIKQYKERLPAVIKMNYPIKTEGYQVKQINQDVTIYQPKMKQTIETLKEFGNEKIGFKIAEPKNVTYRIQPVPSTKNDKVNLFIDAYANNYRQLAQQLSRIKWDEEGVHLPEQDKVFFETEITNKAFNQYITTSENLAEYTKQQVDFTWFKSPIYRVKEDKIYKGVHSENTIGYEFSLQRSSGLALDMVNQQYTEKPLREFLELSKTLLKGEKVIIQFGFKSCESDWWKDAEAEIKNNRKGSKPTDKSKLKLGFAGFDCCLRLIVNTADKSRLETVARGYILSLKQLDDDNKLIEKKVHKKKFDAWLNKKVLKRKITVPYKFTNRFILTHREIKNFIKIPQRTLQKDFELDVNEREETTVHKSLLSKSGLRIGHSKVGDENYPITLPFNKTKQALDDFMKTYVFMGAPRTGKDTSQCNFLIEAAKFGCGAIVPDVIDEKGNDRGMADTLRDAIPKDKLIDVDLCDTNYPIYLGFDDLIELIGEGGVDEIASDLVRILDLEEHYASKSLTRLIAKACRCNLYNMFCFLKSDSYAKEVYNQLLSTDELLAMQVKNEYIDVTVPANVKGAVLSRIDDLLGIGIVKNMFAQKPSARFNLKKFIEENKVVLIRMRKTGGVGEFGARVLMNILTLKVFRIKKMLQNDTCTFMVFNEPHQYDSKALTQTMEDMLLECPKYRLGLLFAFHHPAKLPKSLWDNMQTAAMNFFLFKNTNFSVYKDLADQLKPIDIDVAMKTEKYESIFLPYINGKQLTPLFVKMLPPAKDRQEMYDNSDLKGQHAIKYGTPITIVRQSIKEREMAMYTKEEDGEEKPKSKSKKA
ncbi:hypothetical protein [Halalkalibacter krulwichiae]|uniref:AAA-like domain protein n=1 Tax=Halalkalibacter krulwichiae TaxID=199441 RepID=A0A1X9M9H5_9BACI|nr:hypothetical protein [Halalkalibacter krulwichiae]ARK28823.1 hypothetical protein BkAM31D_02565 [Halalkalibacter krulwichiae]